MPIYKTDRKKDGKTGYMVIVNYVDDFGKKVKKKSFMDYPRQKWQKLK